jgi:hypothetical protein
MKKCFRCQTPLPTDARFCFHCGAPQPEWNESKVRTAAVIDLEEDIEAQLSEKFFIALKLRVEREHLAERLPEYSERLYQSGFRDIIGRRFAQAADRLQQMSMLGMDQARDINNYVEELYEELLDFFVIRYCKDLNEVELPDAILKYQSVPFSEVNLFEVIRDYLNLGVDKPANFYTDLLQMPLPRLKNASQAYLFPSHGEKIILVADLSLLATGKEGFGLTERGLYWKAVLQKPQVVMYSYLSECRRNADWIEINGHFFDAGKPLNLRLLRLLGRLRLWCR